MSRPRFWNHLPDKSRREPSADESVLNRLSQGVEAPDLTRSIMGRLGYMPVTRQVARRHRLLQWAGRAGVLFTAMIALGIGFNFYLNSAEIRRPAGPTISDALRHDWQRQQEKLGTMIHTIQNLAPQPIDQPENQDFDHDADTFEPSKPEELKESWIAPVRWV